MSENEYTQYSYNPYQSGQQPQQPQAEAPQAAPKNQRFLNYIFGQNIANKMQGNPLLMTISLLAVAGAFAGIIAISYPESSSDQSAVPVIKAETTAFKQQPSSPGGLEIPNQDSTIFAVMRDDAFKSGPNKEIKNLLEPQTPSETPVEDKLASFAEEVEVLLLDAESNKQPAFSSPAFSNKTEIAKIEPASGAVTSEAPKQASKTFPLKHEKIAAQDLIRKAENKRPNSLHAAGSSPETLAFVRSILDKKDIKISNTNAADIVSQIQPAAGTPSQTTATAPTASSYFVQLGSVTSPEGAKKEWIKLQKTFSSLSTLEHRVQEANLGERGTFYRIQAGPFEKMQATSLCENIKMQRPGGCLVVK